jgi:preprotein translocase subunit YajC
MLFKLASGSFFSVVGASVGASLLTSAQALAQAAAPTAPAAAQNPLMSMVFPLGAVAIFYFLIMRPQMTKQKKHSEFLTKLKRGDEVLTASGILGRIEGLTDLYITLEIAPSVRIRVLRSQIASLLPTATATENAGVKA